MRSWQFSEKDWQTAWAHVNKANKMEGEGRNFSNSRSTRWQYLTPWGPGAQHKRSNPGAVALGYPFKKNHFLPLSKTAAHNCKYNRRWVPSTTNWASGSGRSPGQAASQSWVPAVGRLQSTPEGGSMVLNSMQNAMQSSGVLLGQSSCGTFPFSFFSISHSLLSTFALSVLSLKVKEILCGFAKKINWSLLMKQSKWILRNEACEEQNEEGGTDRAY